MDSIPQSESGFTLALPCKLMEMNWNTKNQMHSQNGSFELLYALQEAAK